MSLLLPQAAFSFSIPAGILFRHPQKKQSGLLAGLFFSV